MDVCRLPLETSEAIIDHLHDDRESLYACSLTCKDWIHRSRTHIFSNVSLNNVDGKLSKFLDAIQSPTQPGQYVRSVILDFYFRNDFTGLRDYSWTQERPALHILAENLSKIRELELYGIRWGMLDGSGKTAILSGFQTVRKFTFDCGRFSTFAEIPELIVSFPALESLVCIIELLELKSYDIPTHLKPPSLRKLQLDGYESDLIMQWFMSKEYNCDIPNLEVAIIQGQEFMAEVFLSNFLEVLGPTLKHLHVALDFSEISPWNLDLKSVDLTQNTSLVSLRFSRASRISKRITAAYLEYLEYIPRLLSRIRSSELESLWIDSRIKDETLDALAWGDIEHALSHPRFSRLQNLTFFNHSAEVDVENLRNHVSQKMPSLAAREILHFCEAENIYYDGSSTYSIEMPL